MNSFIKFFLVLVIFSACSASVKAETFNRDQALFAARTIRQYGYVCDDPISMISLTSEFGYKVLCKNIMDSGLRIYVMVDRKGRLQVIPKN